MPAPISTLWLVLWLSLWTTSAQAVPSFAAQTGQPCNACHVGGLGPQLTPFGRDFKLRGYTARAVDWNIPLAAFAITSYISTSKAQSAPPAAHFGANENLAVDQISLFVAGGVGKHFGAFIQNTYDGVTRAFTWDNLDLRAVTTARLGKSDAVIGLILNNNPTVQDAFNTLPAWAFPYTSSSLVPSPAASPLIGNLAQTTLGLTGYAWIDRRFYLEFGGYRSLGAGILTHLGADPFSPGKISGVAPYGRVAYHHDYGGSNLEVGAFFLDARLFPAGDESAGAADHYTDVGLDGSYFKVLPHGDVGTLNARYTHESQRLNASLALGLASDAHQGLDDVRIDASYYWRNNVGLSAQVFDTWGSGDELLYQANRRRRPDSSGLVFQIDGTPFGDGSSPFGKRSNLRVGVQYTAYFSFDGANRDFDAMGRNAGDNNTLRVFTWVYY